MYEPFDEHTSQEKKAVARKKNYFLIWVSCIGILIGLFIKLFVFEFLHVSGDSMEPTLSSGNTIYVNKMAYGIVTGGELLLQWAQPQKDDIVIYYYNNKIVVKRCVAVAGDLLESSFENGYTLYVGDKTIPLTDVQYRNMRDCSVVPEGFILAIGDNYEESFDSRNYGFVSTRNILGKVICR